MVGGTNHQSQQASQLAPPSSTAPTTAPEEDELLKKNTDCVYFLASPLTCKKQVYTFHRCARTPSGFCYLISAPLIRGGSECEYRHSDVARVNPRDCWYWLNGNCLNPKCGFRHPPLDGLLGTDASTPKAPSVPQLHTHVTLAMPKQGVACIFFQKGFCLKGHLCPFAHAPPNSVNFNKTVNPVTEPPKMAYSHPEKSNFTQNETVKKPIELLLPQAKQARIGDFIDKKIAPPRQKSSRVKIEVPSNKSNHIVYKANHVLDNNRIMSYKDANEYSREPSPGFDVLVENEREDSEYHHNRDESSRSRDTYNESDLRHRLAKQRRGSDSDSHHVSNRLRGRIKIPRSSISPSRNPSFNQTRLKDRIKRRSSEDNNDKGSRGRQIITYDDDAGTTMFTEPKRLLSEEKRRHTQAADALSFEGPKPLSEILKRKRGSFEDSCKERETICGKKEEYKSVSASEVEKESKRVDVKSSSANYDASEVENEEGLIDEDAMLDQELEAYDHTNGDYDYEQIDGEDYNLDEGEIPDEEYVDEDGEYATKESVPY